MPDDRLRLHRRARREGDFKVDGELTIRGITKPVTFDFDFGGFGGDPYGNYKGGATARPSSTARTSASPTTRRSRPAACSSATR